MIAHPARFPEDLNSRLPNLQKMPICFAYLAGANQPAIAGGSRFSMACTR
jgi:hypothetical protein